MRGATLACDFILIAVAFIAVAAFGGICLAWRVAMFVAVVVLVAVVAFH